MASPDFLVGSFGGRARMARKSCFDFPRLSGVY